MAISGLCFITSVLFQRTNGFSHFCTGRIPLCELAYLMQVLIMEHICSPCIATESVCSTSEHVQEFMPDVCYVLKESSYVDDLIHRFSVK